jgi:hypothetical protein
MGNLEAGGANNLAGGGGVAFDIGITAKVRPGAGEMAKLREACGLMLASRENYDAGKEADAVGLLMECDDDVEEFVRKGTRGKKQLRAREVVYQAFVARMMRRDLVGAATILWPKHVFDAEPWAVGKIWGAMDDGSYVSVLGGGGVGKSYSVGVRYFMEFVHDPDATRVDLVSKNDEKLKKLFADFVNLHRQACVKLPGSVEAETISTDKMGGWGIFRNLIRAGEESSSVLKGTHEKPRTIVHPVYGHRTARFVMIDEAQDVSPAVFDDVGNILLSIRSDDGDGGKRRMRQITLTANPSLPNSRYGEQNKPVGGWSVMNDDMEDWIAKLGARCVRVDALKTENVKSGKDLFQGMITAAGVRKQLTMCDGNENHPLWWTYVRGFFPPEGAMSTLIPHRWLAAAEGEWIFENNAIEHCGVDVARMGGDSPAMAFIRVGLAVAWRDYSGHEYKLSEPGWRVQFDSVIRLAQGDTQEVADDIMRRLRDTSVRPEHVAVDMTGSSGVFDLLVHQWNDKGLSRTETNTEMGVAAEWQKWAEPEQLHEVAGGAPVIGVNYARKPSLLKVAVEDSGTPRDMYVNTATELCYALAKYFELGYIRYGKGIGQRTLNEISTRKGGLTQGKGKRLAVESKDAHKRRLPGSSSPDELDAVTLALFSARLGTPDLQPKAKGTQIQEEKMGVRPKLRDGESFNIKDKSGFAATTIESIVSQREGGDKGKSMENQLAFAGGDPSTW